jgi:non-specific serine/threonine protein kinase
LLQLKHPNDQPGAKRQSGTSRVHSKPSLLILPTSLLGNWQREVERFAPELRMFVAHRSLSEPADLKRVAADPGGELAGYDLVATTYGLARREKWLADVNWSLLILDEAQAIKNAGAAQSKAIKSIPARGRIILTGTPVENHLGDLWSLFDFCSPGLLGTATEFKKFVKAGDDQELSKRLSAVRRLIRPYVLRRMKTDPRIVPDLPDKTELRVDCGLTTTQAALYQKVTQELERALDRATGIQRRGMVLAALMQLKQICNHPSLYLKQDGFAPAASGKFAELRSISQTIIERQEKLLVFSQFQSMCNPLADALQSVFNKPGLVLTGKTSPAMRGKMVESFQQESGLPFFVISVKAGGTGLNLTQASHVVHFDRWWNPAVEDQATDRAFRIGQKRNVMVHKFVCRGTFEEKIDELIESKKRLSKELFSGEGEIPLTEMSNEQLLKFVALDVHKATTV